MAVFCNSNCDLGFCSS